MRAIPFLSLLLAVAATVGQPAPQQDPRFRSIAREEIAAEIRSAGRRIEAQLVVIDRAAHSGFAATAYDEYTRLCKARPDDAQAQLLRGCAANALWRELMQIDFRKANAVLAAERESLAQAYRLAPQSPEVLREYGFFRWQLDDHMDEGLALLRKAAQMKPHDAHVRELLGLVYSNSSGNAYDPKRAKSELSAALRLDPTYARPYLILAIFNVQLHDKVGARDALLRYLALTPPKEADTKQIKPLRKYLGVADKP